MGEWAALKVVFIASGLYTKVVFIPRGQRLRPWVNGLH